MVVTLLKAALLPKAAAKVVMPVLFKVKLCVPLVASFTVAPKVRLPLDVLRIVLAVSVIALLALPKLIGVLVVLMVPATLIAAGAVAVRPPANVKVSPAPLPSNKLPVFKNKVAVFVSLTVVVVPNNSRL